MKRLISILMIAAFILAGMPAVTTSFTASAASPYWKNIEAEPGDGELFPTAIYWKKLTKAQQKKISGIAVFRDGEPIKYIKKSATRFVDEKIKASTKYSYQLKTYKKSVKKVKMYFNKNTGEWQTKKIKRAKTKKVKNTIYKYKNASQVLNITTYGPDDYDDDDFDFDDDSDDDEDYNQPDPNAFSNQKSPYSYEMHFLSKPYGKGTGNMIYIKTDNPLADLGFSIRIYKQGDKKASWGVETLYYWKNFADLDVLDGEHPDNGCKVKGGYLVCYGVSEDDASTKQSQDSVGNFDYKIVEFRKEDKFKTYREERVVCSKTVYLADPVAEKKAWMQSVINQVTTKDMTNPEKMSKIADYMYLNSVYPKVDANGYVNLISDATRMPWERNKEGYYVHDSYTSPYLLVDFGDMIGYPLESLYPKYARGTAEWGQYHYYAQSKEDGSMYQFCPLPGDAVDRSSFAPINFDTYKFYN